MSQPVRISHVDAYLQARESDILHSIRHILKMDGRLSEHQEKFKSDIETHCGEYIVARCLDDIKPLLEGVMF